MMENQNQQKKSDDIPRSLTLYVVFSILMIIIYTVVELIISTVSGITHDTLTTCFFACFSGEVLCCALIKIFKLKSGSRYDDNNNI